MRYFKGRFILLILLLTVIFVANAAIMYHFYGINMMDGNAGGREREEAESAGNRGSGKDGGTGASGAAGNEAEGGHGKAAGGMTTADKDPEYDGDEDTADKNGTETNGEGEQAEKENGGKADDLFMTSAEVIFLNRLGLTDKLSAMRILAKLKGEEADEIYQISSDGVTFSEYADITEILENRLPASDIEKLKDILDKNRMLYAVHAQNDR